MPFPSVGALCQGGDKMIMTQTGVTTVSPHVGAGLVPALLFWATTRVAPTIIIARTSIRLRRASYRVQFLCRGRPCTCPIVSYRVQFLCRGRPCACPCIFLLSRSARRAGISEMLFNKFLALGDASVRISDAFVFERDGAVVSALLEKGDDRANLGCAFANCTATVLFPL